LKGSCFSGVVGAFTGVLTGAVVAGIDLSSAPERTRISELKKGEEKISSPFI